MRVKSLFWPAMLAAFASIGTGALVSSLSPATAHAQPSPMPTECVCSRGVNIGSDSSPVVIRHCQCGILNCAVVVNTGQLQCSK